MMPSRSRCLSPGQVLAGRYRIVTLLGHGGMGEVYEAEDTVLGTPVALKVIRGEENETAVRRFQREVVLARTIAHPNVCRVFDFFTDEAVGGFFTMELLKGRTLAEVLRRGPLTLEEARRIALAVSEALSAAHSHGIIHRDLKPANIFLNEDGRVVVTDFGLARAAAGSGAFGAMETASHVVAGTPAYMAPEQLTGAEPSPTADLYALGVVMYEMTTGQLPWAEHRESRFTSTPTPPGIDPLWDGIALRCLSVAPARRFESAEELRLTLLGKKAIRRNSLQWAALGLAVVVIGGFAWFVAPRRSAPPRPEAVSWYERGVAALHDGDYNAAARQLQMAVDADAEFAMAHARLAEAWAEQDYADRARQSMLQASTIAANHPVDNRIDALRLLAIQMMVARDLAGSVTRYQTIAEAEPNPDTLYELARALERNAKTDDAIARYREVIAARPNHAAAWARLAALLGRKGDFNGAAEAFDKAESIYNTSGNLAGVTEVRLRRSIVLSSYQGQVASAAKVLDSALKLAEATGFESQRIRILLRRGILARQSDNPREAERFATQALQLADENRMEQYSVDGLLELGNLYLQKRDLADADKYAANALRFARGLNSRYHEARAIALIASIRSQQSQLEEARSGAERALAFYRAAGYKAEALSMLALIAQVRSQSGDAAGALSAFEEQLKLTNPANVRALAGLHLRIGITQVGLERYAEALSHLDIALNAPDATTRAYAAMNKAEILVAVGSTAEARKLLSDDKLLTEPSGVVKARAAGIRATAALQESRYAEAVADAAKAIREIGPRDPFLRRRFEAVQALALARAGQRQKAAALCATAPKEVADPRAAASALLLCAEAASALGQNAAAVERATDAEKLLARLDQPEAQWRACLLRAGVKAGEECASLRDSAATRWGRDLWNGYLNRADVRARLSRRTL